MRYWKRNCGHSKKTVSVNVGMESNPDIDANNDPAFLIGGIIYSIKENFDVDFGAKCGLTKSEKDISVLAGITFRF